MSLDRYSTRTSLFLVYARVILTTELILNDLVKVQLLTGIRIFSRTFSELVVWLGIVIHNQKANLLSRH